MGLKEALIGKLTKEELSQVKTAYDHIGDIAILEVEDPIKKKGKLIAETLLKINSAVKVVLKKKGAHSGEFRLQEYSYLAGDKRKETVHKENSVSLKLDVEKTYFSPRLSTERKRIGLMIKPDEEILIMFSGCGPYPLVLLNFAPQIKHIVSVELNPDAVNYQRENLVLNKSIARKFKGFEKKKDSKEYLLDLMEKKLDIICGDANKIVPNLGQKFDRIIMPLPKTADEFLDAALKVSKKGTIIHFYDFLDEVDIPQKAVEKIGIVCKKRNMKYEVLSYVKCGSHSPKHFRVCIDFRIK